MPTADQTLAWVFGPNSPLLLKMVRISQASSSIWASFSLHVWLVTLLTLQETEKALAHRSHSKGSISLHITGLTRFKPRPPGLFSRPDTLLVPESFTHPPIYPMSIY